MAISNYDREYELMWSRGGAVKWSPCELDYLKENRNERSINELSLYLAKSRSAVKRKLDELDGKAVPKTNKKGTTIGKRNDIVIDGKPCFFRSGWEAMRSLRQKLLVSWKMVVFSRSVSASRPTVQTFTPPKWR